MSDSRARLGTKEGDAKLAAIFEETVYRPQRIASYTNSIRVHLERNNKRFENLSFAEACRILAGLGHGTAERIMLNYDGELKAAMDKLWQESRASMKRALSAVEKGVQTSLFLPSL